MQRVSIFAALAVGACTLTHPLEKYGNGGSGAGPGAGGTPDNGTDAAPEPPPGPGTDSPDAGADIGADSPNEIPPDATVDDAGCAGNPDILEPTDGQNVGPAIHLRVDAPTCIRTMIVYLNYADVLHVTGHTIDTWISVPMGPNKLAVNGWAGTATAHPSPLISFTRTN